MWSILLPQALAGVAAVGLLYATVRRWYGPAAGLIAGLVLAVTPVAVLMFRFNNPDALLVLLLVAAAYATVRAVETASARWMLLAGTAIGFAFLTKMLQALLVVPAFALVYLIAAPAPVRRRILHLLLGGVAIVGAAGWWIAIVELVPARYRPYVGGSQSDSILELTLGYNGLGRITGEQVGSVGGGGGWGQTGLTRLFGAANGGQIAWLLPAALILLAAGLALRARAARTDRVRAGFLLWGGWLLTTGLVFSLMAGIYHAYYTVALAPAVGALVGMGAATLWQRRHRLWVRMLLAATVAVSTAWSWTLLSRSADWQPWLRVAVAVLGTGAVVALLLAGRSAGRFGLVAAGVALIAVLAGPTGYAVQTAATAHTGAIPSAGPAVTSGMTGPGGMGRPAGRGNGRTAERRQRPRGARGRAGYRRRRVHLGRRSGRCQQRRRLPVGHRGAGDGARRLQRQRPVTDPRRVPAVRRRRRDPLLHRRIAAAQRLGQRHRRPDRDLGDADLHRDRDRWRDRVRPHRRLTRPTERHRRRRPGGHGAAAATAGAAPCRPTGHPFPPRAAFT